MSTYLYLYLRPARVLLMLQLTTSGALSELSVKHVHWPYIVAGVASR